MNMACACWLGRFNSSFSILGWSPAYRHRLLLEQGIIMELQLSAGEYATVAVREFMQCSPHNAWPKTQRTCGRVDCCSVFFLREHFMNSVINKNHYTELNWIKSSCFFFLKHILPICALFGKSYQIQYRTSKSAHVGTLMANPFAQSYQSSIMVPFEAGLECSYQRGALADAPSPKGGQGGT